jgi:predicted nucleic acid-binding protein
VRDEVKRPRTPEHVKAAFLPQIHNLRPRLNEPQSVDRRRVHQILQGKASPGKHAADASHLSEAAETGCSYFITRDNRLFKKRDELHTALPPTLTIVTLEEFFDIYDAYATG